MARKLAVGWMAIGLVAAACGDGGSGSVRAAVTLTDGTGIVFDESCQVSSQENIFGFEGVDRAAPFGILATWDRTVVAQPGTFDASDSGMALMWVLRQHPTDASSVRISTVSSGVITFTAVGYESGDLIEGTFDDVILVRNDVDDMVNIRLDDGTFTCIVP
jgi:hypothetical protein